uniref:Translation elongation factor EFTu-like domain-containing protein n=1 Tax=Glossina austeni TaxID=7395 RepID=A0A1A9V6G3_GLOAU
MDAIINERKKHQWQNEAQQQNIVLSKLEKKLRKTLIAASFSENFPIFRVSAQNGRGIQELLNGMKNEIHIPVRLPEKLLVMYIDHYISIRGQGTICTGTIVQGQLKINDLIELPAIGEQRKVKSLQMSKRPVLLWVTGWEFALHLFHGVYLMPMMFTFRSLCLFPKP